VINHVLLLVFSVLATLGSGLAFTIWSRSGIDLLIKMLYGGTTILGFIITLKLLGVI
jgi:hypothetical protein